eukprot:scaffold1130_cov195-Pinguiococcus_pyrenoidosus.AAC.8
MNRRRGPAGKERPGLEKGPQRERSGLAPRISGPLGFFLSGKRRKENLASLFRSSTIPDLSSSSTGSTRCSLRTLNTAWRSPRSLSVYGC